MKIREMLDRLDEISRRDFLKGVGASAGLAAMGDPTDVQAQRLNQFDTCKKNGVAYMKSIGSYPRMSNGQSSDDVIKARCIRQPATAFPTPEPTQSQSDKEKKRNEIRKKYANKPDLLSSLEEIWKDEDAGKK